MRIQPSTDAPRPFRLGDLGRAFLHIGHSRLGFGLCLKAAHALHRSSGLGVHHRALVAGGIEGDVDRLGKSRCRKANDKSS